MNERTVKKAFAILFCHFIDYGDGRRVPNIWRLGYSFVSSTKIDAKIENILCDGRWKQKVKDYF